MSGVGAGRRADGISLGYRPSSHDSMSQWRLGIISPVFRPTIA